MAISRTVKQQFLAVICLDLSRDEEQHFHINLEDPDYARPTLEQLSTAMRRDEFFRPIKKPITIRIDADVLAWLQASGEGYQTRLNQILRARMEAEQTQGNVRG